MDLKNLMWHSPAAPCMSLPVPCSGWYGRALRSTQETMPAVTEFCRRSGLPSASTHSPTRRPPLAPSRAAGSASADSIFTIARSDTLDAHTTQVSLA